MEKSSIEYLVGLGVQAHREATLHTPSCPDALVLQDGQSVKDLEHLHAGRRRYRGTFKTSSQEDFIGYVKKHGEELGKQPRVFVEPEGPLAVAIFNLGTAEQPGHADDKAILSLSTTAGWDALRKAHTAAFDQRGLIDLLGDWRHLVRRVVAEDETELSIAATVTAIRQISIKAKAEDSHVTGDFSANRSRMEQIEASAGAKTPAHLVFRLATHEGLAERDITLRLGIATGGDKPVLRLRIEAREALEESIAQEFKELLTGKLAGVGELFIGSFTA